MKKYQHYINGEWIDASSKDLIPVINPANEEIIGEITCGKDEDINHAVESAKKSLRVSHSCGYESNGKSETYATNC